MGQRYTVKLNSVEKIEQLLQEIYNQTCQELQEIQNEINKLGNSTTLVDATIEEKTKYAKAMNDFTTTKIKTVQLKFEVAKFMGEIVKHNNSLKDTLNDPSVQKKIKLDISAWKDVAELGGNQTPTSKPEIYTIK